MLALLLSLTIPALADTASVRDCEQEAAEAAEFATCGGDWLSLGSCEGGMTAALFNYPESLGGYSCDEKMDLVLDAHADYLEADQQEIAEEGPSVVLDALGRCADSGAYSCAELRTLARETDAFIDGIDLCDRDQAPVFEDFLADVRASWWDQCVDDSLAGQERVR